MPSKASQDPPYNQRCSPTILMSRADHFATGNWGPSPSSQSFRAREKEAIGAGTYEGYVEAFELNATDIMLKFPEKYDTSIAKARVKLTGSSGWDNWRACIQGVRPTENAAELNGIAAGPQIAVYAAGAILNQAYTLVLGDAGPDGHAAHACMRTLQVLNPTLRYANSSGFISTTVGTVTYSTPGTYEVCFKDNGPQNTTGTAGATFTVL